VLGGGSKIVHSDSARKLNDSVVRVDDGRSTRVDVAEEIDTAVVGETEISWYIR
jgi:hypothetical protein